MPLNTLKSSVLLLWLAILPIHAQAAEPQQPPAQAEELYSQGKTLHEQKRYAEAESAYRKALDLFPAYPKALVWLGSLYEDQKRYDEAAQAFRELLSSNPKHEWARYSLGRVLLLQKKFTESIENIQAALALNPKRIWTHYYLGLAYYYRAADQPKPGDEKAAIAAFQRVLEMDPQFERLDVVYAGLGFLYEMERKNVLAAKYYQKALQRDPNQPMARQNLYGSLFLSAMKETGITGYLGRPQFLLEAPVDPKLLDEPTRDGFSLLGDEARGEMRFAQAEGNFRKALKQNPDNLWALNGYAVCLTNSSHAEQAIAPLQSAISLNAQFFPSHLHLGSAYLGTFSLPDRLKLAQAAYRKALELSPDLPEAHYNLGICHLQERSYQSAKTAFERVLQFRPGDSAAAYNLSLILDLRTYVIDEELRRADLLKQKQAYKTAEEKFKGALEFDRTYPKTHLAMGDLYRGWGKADEAARSYREALELDPQDPVARQRLNGPL